MSEQTEREPAPCVSEVDTLRTALEEVYDAFRSAGLGASYTYADELARAALDGRTPNV
jgi:hypothetical protein